MSEEKLFYMMQAMVNMLSRIDPAFLPQDQKWDVEEESLFEDAKQWVDSK